MSKKPEKSEVEWLRGENRRLKSENRNLKKQLSRRDKKVKAYEEHIDLSAEPEIVEEELLPKPGCPECGEPTQSVSLGVKFLITCTNCKYRKTVKK